MDTNIIDLIQNSDFVRRLYPYGVVNFFVGKVLLSIDGSITICIHSIDKPAIEVAKWGKWNENYNVVVIELYAQSLNHCSIENWHKVSSLPHKIEINKSQNGNYYILHFSDEQTIICIETDWFLFQGCSTYIL